MRSSLTDARAVRWFVFFGLLSCASATETEFDACRIAGAAPRTVDETIARINRLPRPVSIACFTASLPRPLSLTGTTSRFSAQPAGPNDPRLFLFTDGAILSIVTGGDGKDLLEIGELVEPTRTLKAELRFPIEHEVTRDDAYAHLEFSSALTSCGLCHAAEAPSSQHAFARVSDALKPSARTLVPLQTLKNFAATCDRTTGADRCSRLDAIYELGEVKTATFPAAFTDFTK